MHVHMGVPEANVPSFWLHLHLAFCLHWEQTALKTTSMPLGNLRSEHGVLFPTAAEAEYPSLLCNRMAQCVLQMAASMGVVPQVPQRLKDLLRMGMGPTKVLYITL